MKLCRNPEESPLKNVKFSNFLQELVDSALLNANRKDSGKRYSTKLIIMCTHYFTIGGLQCYEILYANLPIPSVTRVRLNLSSQGIPYEGYFRFKELSEFLIKRKLPMKVVISEDGTRCKGQIQYHRLSNQIIGFPLPLDSHGLPITGSFPATSAKTIAQYFEENSPASNVYCLVAQPISPKAPSFCLALFGTDSKFTASDVKARWKWMISEAKKHGIEVVCSSSDGDTRLLSAMCSLVFQKKCLQDWFFASPTSSYLYIQDSVHIGTKLKSRLLSPSIILPMGKYVASRGHLIELVKILSKDKHCLTMSHLDPKDKMNFRAVQIMTDPQVVSLLREHCNDAEATATFLEMTRDVVYAYLDKTISALERVEMIWKWIFFLRIWRQWVKDQGGYSVGHNFLSLNSYFCIELNAHGLIHMIKMFRDSEEPHLFLPWLFSSQACEELFRCLRSMTSTFSTVVNFSVLEIQHRVKRVDFQNEAKCKLSGDFEFPRSKRVALEVEKIQESVDHVLPEDIDIDFVIQSAKDQAVKRAVLLGMLPAKRNNKIPPMELPKQKTPSKKSAVISDFILYEDIEHEEEDENHIELDTSSETEDDEDGLADCDACDAEEDLLVVSTGSLKLNAVKDVEVTARSPFVRVLDGNGAVSVIRKSSLCWLLSSGDVKLSSDRLVRVKSSEVSHSCLKINEPVSAIPSVEEEVSIGDWCAFKSENKSTVIGRILAFSYSSGATWRNQEYSAITAPTAPPRSNARGVACLCTWYKLLNNKKLEEVRMDTHGYYNLSNYICHVPRPKIAGGKLVSRCSLADISKAK